jgi:hypothetical protein
MKQIFARWPKLERCNARRLLVVSMVLLLMVVLGWLAMKALDGYIILPEKRFTWQPVGRITRLVMNFDIYNEAGERVNASKNVYVYECDPNEARIEPNGWMKSGSWVSRGNLEPDVCEDGQP